MFLHSMAKFHFKHNNRLYPYLELNKPICHYQCTLPCIDLIKVLDYLSWSRVIFWLSVIIILLNLNYIHQIHLIFYLNRLYHNPYFKFHIDFKGLSYVCLSLFNCLILVNTDNYEFFTQLSYSVFY